jgi:hypothetical protein
MRSGTVVIRNITFQDTPQMRFVEHDHMIQALAPD